MNFGDRLGDGGHPLLLGVFIRRQERDGAVVVLRIETFPVADAEGILVGALGREGSVKTSRSVGR